MLSFMRERCRAAAGLEKWNFTQCRPLLSQDFEHIGFGAFYVAAHVDGRLPDHDAALHDDGFMVGFADDDRDHRVAIQVRRAFRVPLEAALLTSGRAVELVSARSGGGASCGNSGWLVITTVIPAGSGRIAVRKI